MLPTIPDSFVVSFMVSERETLHSRRIRFGLLGGSRPPRACPAQALAWQWSKSPVRAAGRPSGWVYNSQSVTGRQMKLLAAGCILFGTLVMSGCAYPGPNLGRSAMPGAVLTQQKTSSQAPSVPPRATPAATEPEANPPSAVASASAPKPGPSDDKAADAPAAGTRDGVAPMESAKGQPPLSTDASKAQDDASSAARPSPGQPPKRPAAEPVPVQATTAGSVPLVDLVLGLLFLAVTIIFIIRYLCSGSAHARKQVHGRVAQFDRILREQNEVLQAVQRTVADAGRDYIAAVRRTYLQAVSLDEIRRVAPGVRLQPLYARGMHTLLDCQGWSAGNLLQVRGIGPDSATRIAAACGELTRVTMARPIRLPEVSDGTIAARQLYERIHALRRVQTLLDGQREALGAVLKDLEPKGNLIHSRTSFLRWLLGSELKGSLKEALDEARVVEKLMLPEGDWGHALAQGTARLSGATQASSGGVGYDNIAADATANAAFYRSALSGLLGPQTVQSPDRVSSTAQPPRLPSASPSQPITIQVSIGGPSVYSIPGGRPAETAAKCWVPANIEKNIGGFTIPGGLNYVGRNLRSVKQYTTEPALIDPALETMRSAADCHVRMLSYWSSYTLATPEARASYLQWLASGKCDPAADVGYVFLFFTDWSGGLWPTRPVIRAPGPKSQQFSTKCGGCGPFTDQTGALTHTRRAFSNSRRQSARPSGVPRKQKNLRLLKEAGFPLISGAGSGCWLVWKSLFRRIWLTPGSTTTRERVFLPQPNGAPSRWRLFFRRNTSGVLRTGLMLPANRTQLKLTYKPASASFGGPFSKDAGLPDVSVLSTVYTKLNVVATDCFQQIDSYSRFVARHGGRERSFEALALLPATLWPDPIKQALCVLKKQAAGSQEAVVMRFSEILRLFPEAAAPAKSSYASFCGTLGGIGLGIEPDIRFGAAMPGQDDPVSLFPSDMPEKTSGAFGITALLVQLASFVAGADGEFSDEEAQKLREHIHSRPGLTLPEQQRLVARMATYREKAPSSSSLKKAMESIEPLTRTAIVDLLLTILHADGAVSPAEVKALEVIYAIMGIDAAALYAKLHALAVHDSAAEPIAARKNGAMRLNAAKIEELKAVSAAVTDKLTVIFNSGADQEAPREARQEQSEQPSEGSPSTLLGLDPAHADLLTVLLGRPNWTRAEFEELCADKCLMPDGAIERINEAAYEKFDQPVIDGEDPLEISSQLLLEEKTA